jgi:hypothetical protein
MVQEDEKAIAYRNAKMKSYKGGHPQSKAKAAVPKKRQKAEMSPG